MDDSEVTKTLQLMWLRRAAELNVKPFPSRIRDSSKCTQLSNCRWKKRFHRPGDLKNPGEGILLTPFCTL